MSDLTAYKELTGYRKPCTTVQADDFEMTVQLEVVERRRNRRLFEEDIGKMAIHDPVENLPRPRSHTPPTK